MELFLTIKQRVSQDIEVSSSTIIILDDMKYSPDLQILDAIHNLKKEVITKADAELTKMLQ